MKFKKQVLIGLGVLVFLIVMVINVQLVQNPMGSSGVELTLVELSASAGGEGIEGGYGFSILCFLLDWWNSLISFVFGK